jgi:hypothetical protein
MSRPCGVRPAASELVHQCATHRVAGQLDAIELTVDENVLVAKIVVQVFDSSDPVRVDGDVRATAERPPVKTEPVIVIPLEPCV